jgi:O-antigen/teichoic acid export membrane protein
MLVLAITTLHDGRWRWLGLQWSWLREALPQCWPLYLTRLGTVGSLYADRFIISFFLGLELTGVYVFFWSAANVVHSITVYGTMQPRVPALVTAAESDGARGLRKRLTQYQIETMGWAVLLFAMLWVAIGLFVQVAHKPQLDAHTAIFLWIILAMLLRILADSYHFALYALRRDRITVTINLAGAAGSALLNALLVPTMGLAGAVIASLVTAAGLLFSRFMLSRPLASDGALHRPSAGPGQAGLPGGAHTPGVT